MFSVLLPLAEATGRAVEAAAEAHGEAAASGITKLFSDFGISGPFFLAQVINFSIVAFLLWRFAFKPVLANIETRQKTIDSGLKYAAEMKAKLDATQTETMQVLQKAHVEAAKLVARATDPRDRRSVLVSLTDEGVLLLDRIAQARRRTAEATFSALSPKQRGELTRLLTVCCGPNERCGSGGPQPRPAHSRRGH